MHPAAPDAPHFSVRTPVNSPSIVLAFDSSTEWLSVALDLGDGRVLQGTEPGGARASQRLLPLVGELLAQAGCTLADVGLIGFGAGPGAFTGLRAACAAAQGLARGLRCPVVPVPTLLAVAAAAEPALRDVGLIGFGAGPGAFTGLRAACAAAQGLGRGLERPVVAVPTLLAVAVA
ncbi:MAG: tRNA (adenosine(37)-N6)-threonylcarbamoyltransferase complex dimerization subunit type 1 TsaB, partial [Betaproteobacteria bacterium]|nr:tRNA (adenosine(37)-N6)-threonylcarbamoyltransferase complex dimerization subunit type 1 TsaB [Betaproteobacteria bacterium]